MLIGIDAREIQDGVFTGIGRALNNFLAFFETLQDEHRCILFSEKPLPGHYGPRITSVVCAPASITIVWDQIVLSRLIKKHTIDLFYSPYYKVPMFASIPVISTIFDLMYIYYPIQWRGTGLFSRWYYRIFGGLMANRAHTIFTCSNYSKSEILQFYKIAPAKVQVIYLGLSDRYRQMEDMSAIESVKKKFAITSPYILYTGNFKPHKNVGKLVTAFDKMCAVMPNLQLVLAGNTDHYFDKMHDIIQASSARTSIITTGLVTHDEQIALYNGASVFLYPSLYEGFGYPPLEAMACGTPVVSSDRTSLREIVGDAAIPCDPTDADDIARQTVSLLEDANLRNRCVAQGLLQAQQFTNTHFCNHFYEMLLSGR